MRDRLELAYLFLELLTVALDIVQRLAEWWPFCVL
jgi:hypothetical protein|tara:strand:- start:3028 stop:3132 length:105 start_codon:yes stop_codon:yes gene_type:complete